MKDSGRDWYPFSNLAGPNQGNPGLFTMELKQKKNQKKKPSQVDHIKHVNNGISIKPVQKHPKILAWQPAISCIIPGREDQ